MTGVVNVRTVDPRLTNWPVRYIYVGRAKRDIFAGHPLANPFRPASGRRADRLACLEQYRAWLLSEPWHERELRRLAEQVRKTGLPLGCYCAPRECHADVLAEMCDLINGRTGPRMMGARSS